MTVVSSNEVGVVEIAQTDIKRDKLHQRCRSWIAMSAASPTFTAFPNLILGLPVLEVLKRNRLVPARFGLSMGTGNYMGLTAS